MTTLHRRHVLRLAGFASAAALVGASAGRSYAEDLSTLNQAPTLGDRVLGSPDAKVTIIEYASATCPHCARFHTDVFPQLKTEFIDTGKVKFIFREFPFDDLALAAFMLARCAPADKYYPMISTLYEQQKVWAGQNAKAELFKIAQMAGLTQDAFDKCLQNEEVAKGIIEIQKKASQDYGVEATPTFFINGKVYRGEQSIDQFRQYIKDAGA